MIHCFYRRALVFENKRLAGRLVETGSGYRFTYDEAYLADPKTPSISIRLPKRVEPYDSEFLHAFFYGLMPGGLAQDAACADIRPNDYFGQLLRVGAHPLVRGSVTVVPDETSL